MRLGISNKEIGRQLGVAEGTVKAHVREVLGKLGAISRTEAVNLAMQRGLLR
jgi:DNA-binding NarL/FixJ family response regulator